jgi:photosystem II stability/assembly factor-like uncharacterized protein
MTWTEQAKDVGGVLRGVSFTDTDEDTGTVVGDDGVILRTTDGGANWVLEISGTRNNLNGVSFVDADIGTAVGDRGNILRRTDGGGG